MVNRHISRACKVKLASIDRFEAPATNILGSVPRTRRHVFCNISLARILSIRSQRFYRCLTVFENSQNMLMFHMGAQNSDLYVRGCECLCCT